MIAVWLLIYRHRYNTDFSAHVSHDEALVAASGIAITYAKECDADTHGKLLALDAETDTDQQIIDLYNTAREGDESLEIQELTMEGAS